jgi:predicted nuclease of predicted toxin-antitoxin system
MTIRFLLDENLSPRLVRALKRARPEIDVLRVGDAGAPPLGTKDPDLLVWCDQAQRLLVTNDRTTMPVHLDAHHAAGRQHWGMGPPRDNNRPDD